jgi:uncharacterized protein (DUF58 family)
VKRGAPALAFLLLGALFVPSWPIQLICYLGLSVTLLSFAYSGLTRRAIRVERDASELTAHAHASVEIGVTIRNASFLPVAFVAVRDRQGGLRALEPTETVFPLAPRATARLRYSLQTVHRGIHEIGPLAVLSADPLGLFPWNKTIESRCRVTVLPAIGTIGRRVQSGFPGGDLRVRDIAFEDPTRFRAIREYLPGDDTRRIHWKISARLGALHTVEYEPAVSAACVVLLDLRLSRYPLRLRHHFVERAVETAATLIVAAALERQATGLCASAELDGKRPAVGIGRGMSHAIHILELLARILPVEEAEGPWQVMFGAAVRVPLGGRVCFVGAAPEAEAIRLLRESLARGTRLEVYQLGAGDADRTRAAPRGVRVYSVRDYGEELGGE